MLHGKARVAQTRAMSQKWFDDDLIDEFIHGEPRDPRDDRDVRIIYGASRLAECVQDRVVAQSEGLDDDSSGVWPAPQFKIAQLPVLQRPMPPSVVEPDSVLVPFALTAPTSVKSEASPSTFRPESSVELPAARSITPLQLTPRMLRREVENHFNWVRFFGGVCAGGVAAAVVIAVMVGI